MIQSRDDARVSILNAGLNHGSAFIIKPDRGRELSFARAAIHQHLRTLEIVERVENCGSTCRSTCAMVDVSAFKPSQLLCSQMSGAGRGT